MKIPLNNLHMIKQCSKFVSIQEKSWIILKWWWYLVGD